MTDSQMEFLELLNAARTQPLVVSPELQAAAQGHSEWMARWSRMTHRAGRSTASSRAQAAGYTGMVAENIAAGQRTAEAVFRAWMQSPGHRRNMLNETYQDIGFGMAASGRQYWTAMFGRRIR